MEGISVAIVFVAIIGFFAFRQWIQHHRRVLMHRERLAAIEKGVDLPTLDHEVKRNTWNVQRIILLMGLIWISLGMAAYLTLSVLDGKIDGVPRGLQMIGIAPIGIGISHLIVYWVGARRENR